MGDVDHSVLLIDKGCILCVVHVELHCPVDVSLSVKRALLMVWLFHVELELQYLALELVTQDRCQESG